MKQQERIFIETTHSHWQQPSESRRSNLRRHTKIASVCMYACIKASLLELCLGRHGTSATRARDDHIRSDLLISSLRQGDLRSRTDKYWLRTEAPAPPLTGIRFRHLECIHTGHDTVLSNIQHASVPELSVHWQYKRLAGQPVQHRPTPGWNLKPLVTLRGAQRLAVSAWHASLRFLMFLEVLRRCVSALDSSRAQCTC